MDTFKKGSTSVCTSTTCYLLTLFPTPSISSVMITTENKDEGSDDHKPADGDIQREYSSD